MLTVVVGLDESGNNKNRRPFGNVYSVMPSTVGPLVGMIGGAVEAVGCCAGSRFVRTSAAAAKANGVKGRNALCMMDLQLGQGPPCSHLRSDIRRYTAIPARRQQAANRVTPRLDHRPRSDGHARARVSSLIKDAATGDTPGTA